MHPTEGMWQEFLDGESDPPVARELQFHSAGCADCRRVIATLGGRREFVAYLLNRLDASGPAPALSQLLSRPRPRSRISPRSLLAAAAVVFCVVTAAGATITSGVWHRAVDWLLGPRPWVQAPLTPIALPQAPEAPSATGVAFKPADNVEITFEQRPQGGEIEIALRSVSQASVTGSAPATYSVRKGRVVIANGDVPASYRITLPGQLRQASIRVGDRVVFSKQGDRITTEAVLSGPQTYMVSFSPTAESSP